MTDIPTGDSYIARRLEGLDPDTERADPVRRAGDELPQAQVQAPATGLLGGLSRPSISERLAEGSRQLAQSDTAPGPPGGLRSNAILSKAQPTPWIPPPQPVADDSDPASADIDGLSHDAHGLAIDTGTGLPAHSGTLTPFELKQARTYFDEGNWTVADAVEEFDITRSDDFALLSEMALRSAATSTVVPEATRKLTQSEVAEAQLLFGVGKLTLSEALRKYGITHSADFDVLSKMASRSTELANGAPATAKADNSPSSSPAGPIQQSPASSLDALSSAVSPIARARTLLESCLEALVQAERPLAYANSRQYDEALFHALSEVERHIDSGARQANEAFALLIDETKGAPLSVFSNTVRTRQSHFQERNTRFKRAVGNAGTNDWDFELVSAAVIEMRQGLETLKGVLEGRSR